MAKDNNITTNGNTGSKETTEQELLAKEFKDFKGQYQEFWPQSIW